MARIGDVMLCCRYLCSKEEGRKVRLLKFIKRSAMREFDVVVKFPSRQVRVQRWAEK